ncbi:hypothetical protein [Streptomyces sp. NPDC048611]|uniref:hypothetical protein n=1 Tax=Streptomyces sp. NPDC048611 TaxID=3155635 RepID=UPI003426AFB8
MMITTRARAYINHGRWVADCPTGCGSARKLEAGDFALPCSECKAISEVEWPADPDAIWSALLKRPFPKNRNWYPEGHPIAVRARLPHGQTVSQLEDETNDNRG